jgi:hypothetical protein
VAAIVERHAALFGALPYERYLFILHLAGGYGGLEHRASCTLLSNPGAFYPRKRYEELLELVSHEFFHVWNVKRIRPRVLGPFDYEHEAYTRSLVDPDGAWSQFARTTVQDWLAVLAAAQPVAERDTEAGLAERTLMLAVLRGALLDLLATGDTERVTAAVLRHLGPVS